MSKSRVRRARKPRVACGGYCPPIQPGELYIEHTMFPSEVLATAAVPERLAECRECAQRYGRGGLFEGRDG